MFLIETKFWKIQIIVTNHPPYENKAAYDASNIFPGSVVVPLKLCVRLPVLPTNKQGNLLLSFVVTN